MCSKHFRSFVHNFKQLQLNYQMSETQKTDLILRNARLIDGTGASSQYGDVAIRDDRMIALGELKDLQAVLELDVGGKVVCPGFVDTHT